MIPPPQRGAGQGRFGLDAPSEQTVLSVRDLVVRHHPSGGWFRRGGVVTAVDGVSFDLAAGEVLGLVGESGCGKSTLARAVVRLIPTDAGSVRLLAGGAPIEMTTARGADLRSTRRRLQIVFQDPYSSLDPRQRVCAIVAEPLIEFGIARGKSARARAAELLSLVGLGVEHLDRFPHELSGGQRQRVGLARALAPGPAVLVLDEPVSALDVSVQAQVVNLLADLRRRLGLAMLFISHDLAVVRHLADRVAVMRGGRIVEIADAEQLYAAPEHPYTRELLAAVPTFPVSPIVL